MIRHNEISSRDLRNRIKNQTIRFGGNCKLKIYGTLSCASGKKIKKENRVFFISEKEALQNGYRPCGRCRKEQYKEWKSANR
ncbi:Ada metal-binding domain-containing protein [Pedobacter hiemivivus]|uniref:Metal-binding protein n=1 Tax=Pedobacter hiemivivus TaxID=2530454 RepID=A0A4R0N4F0_9SPHI|nr:Ada metal-binding domain-containing protein [Pedobacter hiemivivus]TCC93154.1 metal-binding protein [Pedobacter hiemivivus]